MNIIELRKANEAKGWREVPSTCPQRFVNSICEKRSVSLSTNTPIYEPIFLRSASVTSKRMSLEDLYLRKHGREFVSDVQLRHRLSIAGAQIQREAVVVATVSAEEARISAEVTAALFPWEVNK